jgi:8-oxo-dGTP pyrophosphatase MutT (NUDIX family)
VGKHEAYTIVVAFDSDGRRFLAVRNRKRGWELPGGGLHEGEDAVRGAAREFFEETRRPLLKPRLLLSQQRANGRCHVVTGRAGAVQKDAETDPAIEETRFVDALRELSPLAFPDDPYLPIEEALGRRILDP